MVFCILNGLFLLDVKMSLYLVNFFLKIGARSISGFDFRWTLDFSKVSQDPFDQLYSWGHFDGSSANPNGGHPSQSCVADNAYSTISISGKMYEPKQFFDYSCSASYRIVCQLERF